MKEKSNLLEQKEKEIYRFNTSGNCLYPVMKKCFELSDMDVYNAIESEFDIFQKRLTLKKINYKDLKTALVPNQDKDRQEICLVFDTSQRENCWYGIYFFDKLIPLLEKESTYSILMGNYVDIISNQNLLYEMLTESIICNKSVQYEYSDQYFLVYFSRLTQNQRKKIVDGLEQYPWFTGYVNTTHSSAFKSYISLILCNLCVKSKNKIIALHPSDCLDEDNINIKGYPFEEHGFEFVSINEESFNQFLSYKIETEIADDEDISFSFNALFPKFDSYQKIRMNILDEKWNKYLVNKETGKGVILEKIGYSYDDKKKFIKQIYKKICCNYLYNLRWKYGVLLFDVCVEVPTVNGNLRKTTIGLKYLPQIGEIQVITIT